MTSLPVVRLVIVAMVFSVVFVQSTVQFALAGRKPVEPFVTKLSAVEQEALYARITGVDFSGKKSALAPRALKCGTPLAGVNFDNNQTNPQLSSLVSALFERVNMQASYNSPGGHFKLHYNVTGDSAVKNAGVDVTGPLGVGGPDGVPDFINAAGDIFDSVWNIILGAPTSGSMNLGYPLPPSDGQFITSLNPDSLYDIYFVNFGGAFFGATVSENLVAGNFISLPLSQSFTSYIQLDNDYSEINYSAVNDYTTDPLDAVRVTAAHEFFHAIHFGIDATEFEFEAGLARKYWFEMSSVAMEEYIYDNINDYYGYLFNSSTSIPFDAPHMSLETFTTISDYPYAMGVFAIWLTDKFGPDIVRGIWLGCGAPGPNFLGAIDSALISFTNGEYDYPRAFSEFGAALALSGERAKFAPPGFGFEEAAFYPTIKDTLFEKNPFSSVIDTTILGPSHNTYPFQTTALADLQPPPQSNSNSFVFMHDVVSITDGCFKPQLVVPQSLLLFGIKRELTLVAIPKNQFDTALIVRAPFDRIVVDTNLVIAEAELSSTIQGFVDSFACHDTIMVDTLNPANLNDLQPDTIRLRVVDIVPSVNLPDPTRYSDVMFIVTQTSLNPMDYETSQGIIEYPYSYTVRNTSTTIQDTPQPFSLRTPYPNPIMPENSQVIFEALRDPLSRNTDDITIVVSIFTETGELVRDNLSATSGASFTQVAVTWDLTNQSGAPVASGVYLVMEKLLNSSGEALLSEVTKVLVIN